MEQFSLTHHGIKGQRWGVRRYQRPDGTLTPSGKRRARKEARNASRPKNLKEFSDDELQKAVRRMQLEKRYSTLSGDNGVAAGKQTVKNILKGATGVATATTTAITLHNNIGKIRDIVEKATETAKVAKGAAVAKNAARVVRDIKTLQRGVGG